MMTGNKNITHNITEETWIRPFLIFGAGVSALLIVMTEVGNILIIIVVLQKRSLRRKTFLFIPSLAAADILVGIGFAMRLHKCKVCGVQIPSHGNYHSWFLAVA